MFDVGFWELSLILIIALIVVGPEKLPRLASTAGRWAGQARRMVGNLQRELEREAAQTTGAGKQALDETKSVISEIRESIDDTRNSIADIPKMAAHQVKAPEQTASVQSAQPAQISPTADAGKPTDQSGEK